MRPGRNIRCRECRAVLDTTNPISRDHGFCDRKCSELYWERKK